jgi:putative transposase
MHSIVLARQIVIHQDDVGVQIPAELRGPLGCEVVAPPRREPEHNSITERWVQTCRRELLDRTLIWNQPRLLHLLHVLREFGQFYNGHRPHQGIANARPLQPLPVPLAAPDQNASLHIRRRDGLPGDQRAVCRVGGAA